MHGNARCIKKVTVGKNLPMQRALKAPSHGAIFHATCNVILFLGDVKLANTSFHQSLPIFFLAYQTFVTNLHPSRVELHGKLQEKLHRVTGPLMFLTDLMISSSTGSCETSSNIFFHKNLKVAGYKKPLCVQSFSSETCFEQIVLRYGVGFIRLESFEHLGASTITQWAFKKSLYVLN